MFRELELYAGAKENVFDGPRASALSTEIGKKLLDCPAESRPSECDATDLVLVLDTLTDTEEQFEAELELALDLVHNIPAAALGVGAKWFSTPFSPPSGSRWPRRRA